MLDLVDAYTTTVDGDAIRSPILLENVQQALPILMSTVTTFEGDNIPGRINIMHAPRRVLESIPGMTPEVVDDIIFSRVDDYELSDPDFTDLNRRYETWLLAEFKVDLETMRALLPFICAGGDVYKGEIIGFFDDGVGVARAEVIVDTTVPIPRVLFWRDKSHIQAGYTLDSLGTSFQSTNSDN